MNEEWKTINDYPNYSISSLGNVKNKNGFILKTNPIAGLYSQVKLYNNNGKHSKCFLVSRLVGIHYLPNWNDCNEIDHLNGNGFDNRVCNLRWVNRSQNSRYRSKFKNCLSPYKGVCFRKNKQSKCWTAHICINKKLKNLGCFETEIEAFNCWRKAVFENQLEKYYRDSDINPNIIL